MPPILPSLTVSMLRTRLLRVIANPATALLLSLPVASSCRSAPHTSPAVAMAPGAGVVGANSAGAIAAAERAALAFAPADVEFMQGMREAAAQTLGMEPSELREALQDSTLQEVAEAQGVDYADVVAAALASAKADLDAAVEAGRFHIWTATTVEEAIELLTGMPAGVPDGMGSYAPDTLYGRVAAQLEVFDSVLRRREAPVDDGTTPSDGSA